MSFQELNHESLRRIRPLLEAQFPKSTMMLNIIDITLSEKCANEMYKILVYGYNKVPDGDNLFLDIHFRTEGQIDDFSVPYTPEIVTPEMVSAYEKLHDWTKTEEFGAVPVAFVKHLEEIAKRQGGTVPRVNPCDDIYLPMELALKLNLERENLQDDFELDDLHPQHVAKVISHWKYGRDSMEPCVAEILRVFPAAGVYRKIKDGQVSLSQNPSSLPVGRRNEDLVSFVMFNILGTFNALHTLDEYRGKGLARWTMEAASKKLAMEGLIPLCEIEPYNTQSMRIMEKIGFQLAQKVCWVEYSPTAN